MNRPDTTTGEATRQGYGRLMVDAAQEDRLTETKDIGLLKKLVPFARPHTRYFVAALTLMPIAAAAALIQPFMLKRAIDATLIEESNAALMVVVAIFAASIAVEFVTKFGQTYLMQLAGQYTTADLRRAVFDHVQRLRVSYFDREPVGRVVTRMTNDIDAITELFASGAVTAIADLLMLAGIVGFMFYLDVRLTLVTFVALPPLALIVNVFRRWARQSFRSIRVHIAQLNAYLNEQVQGIAVVQAYGREEECADEYQEVNRRYRDANFQAIRYDALLYSVVESVSVACIAVVLFYAARRAGALETPAESALYVGTVVAFYDYIQRFFIPIRDLATKYTIIQSSLASAERIFTLMDHEEVDAPQMSAEELPAAARLLSAKPLPETPDDADVLIAFRDLTFAYKPGVPVMNDLQLDILQGERVGIVGATGSGKTTVTSLLLRLYELQEGAIFIDGEDIRLRSREAHRGRFAVVPQDVFMFTGSVLENVALDAEAPDRERAAAALARVGATELLAARGGLDAVVEERGGNFSAGERQLLAFARALYRDAPLLILDEATANVDSETEHRLQGAVSELLAGRTSLVIAHRLSTIQNLDRILVFHHGRLAEQGTHAALIAQDGIYARLHRLQQAGDAAE